MFSELADEEKRAKAKSKVEGILTKIDAMCGPDRAIGSTVTPADALIWYAVARYTFIFEGLVVPPKVATIAQNFEAIPAVQAWHKSPEYPKHFLPTFVPFVKNNAYLQKRIADTSK